MQATDGIIGVSPEQTTQNIGELSTEGMVETDRTKRFLDIVNRAAGGQVSGEHRGGVSDANFTAALGVPTLDGFGPIGADDHRPTEYVEIESLYQRIRLLASLLTHPEIAGV